MFIASRNSITHSPHAVPCVDVVVVPVGGAGLIAGISCAVKTLKPECKVYGVEPAFAPSYTSAIKAGKPVTIEVTPTLADGLAVPLVGSNAFEIAKEASERSERALTKTQAMDLAKWLQT